jgi:hypothetical protein
MPLGNMRTRYTQKAGNLPLGQAAMNNHVDCFPSQQELRF